MSASIYKITNKVNGKIYIGFTTQDPPEKRWKQHCRRQKKAMAISCAIQKYGADNFTFEVVFTETDAKHCQYVMEPYYIKEFHSQDPSKGYNLTPGGEGTGDFWLGRKHSEETKRKIGRSRLGIVPWNKGIPRTAKEKQKMSANRKGKTKGIKFTEEHKSKISQKLSGRHLSQEHKEKIKLSWIIRKMRHSQ